MKRWGRRILFVGLILLSVFHCWGGAEATPPDALQPGEPIAQGNPDAPAGKPTALILLGVGLVNAAIWGRNRIRRLLAKSDLPG
jgi:hypothetical protein